MFADTHCHLSYIAQRSESFSEVMDALQSQPCPFLLDVGTKPGDLVSRIELIQNETGGAVPDFIHFSAGLWPDPDVIGNRFEMIAQLETDIRKLVGKDVSLGLNDANYQYLALGECGLDRYWNGETALARIEVEKAAGKLVVSDDGPGTVDIAGEEELFEMQLELAKKYSLPVIVHSRDAFEPTLGCLRNAGTLTGVIHCFSYEIAEARAFLDLGWHISFPGTITWGKREADRERISTLLRFVPRDRLLLETDAPYLSPAPHRGKPNTPLLIAHTYKACAEFIGVTEEALASLVLENAQNLFARV